MTARGVCWSTSRNPTISDNHTTDGGGLGDFSSNIVGLFPNTTYYIRAYAADSVGVAYGNQINFTTSTNPTQTDNTTCPGIATVTDYDGNIYNTVRIGNQCWMKENLRTRHYANGDSIPFTTSISSDTSGYCYYPGGDEGNVGVYGYLYNWPAVMHNENNSGSNPSGVQGVCPTGWHVPSLAEWMQLALYVNSQSCYRCGDVDARIAKSLASTTGWNEATSTCGVGNAPSTNNATGFSAVPAGRSELTFTYNDTVQKYNNNINFGSEASFWSATGDGVNAHWWSLYSSDASIKGGDYCVNSEGFSVRCICDDAISGNDVDTTHKVFNIPCSGTTTVSDYDGNIYNTVQIGNQCWMRENLKTRHYANGDSIPLTRFGNYTTSGNCCYPGDNESDVAIYGYLYNWAAVMHNENSSDSNPSGVQGVCPAGWHVPSFAEWTQLTDYVRSKSSCWCGNNSTFIAKSLALTTGWDNSTNACALGGNDQSTNNVTGFSAVPISNRADFWSATQFRGAGQLSSTSACSQFLDNRFAEVYSYIIVKTSWCSVRCLRD